MLNRLAVSSQNYNSAEVQSQFDSRFYKSFVAGSAKLYVSAQCGILDR